MKTYTARLKRWRDYWELHIDDNGTPIGVTQSGQRFIEALDTAADYIATLLDVEPDSFAVELLLDEA